MNINVAKNLQAALSAAIEAAEKTGSDQVDVVAAAKEMAQNALSELNQAIADAQKQAD